MIIKRHKIAWISFIVITIVSLIVSLTTSATISMWGLTYSILLLSPCFIISYVVRFYYQDKVIKMALDKKPKRKIMFFSLSFGLIWSFLTFIPLVIGIIVGFFNLGIFNPYMILAYFVVIYFSFHVSNYFDIKINNKNKTKD